MAGYPNSKRITVRKVTSDRAHIYSIFNIAASDQALMDLKGDAFKLWFYLNQNQNGFTFYLSKVDCINSGITDYRRAVEKLTDKGYLVCNGGNSYTFFELPPPQEIPPERQEKNRKAMSGALDELEAAMTL
ncbi:MAG: hypothetical protein K6G90_14575 [Clostridia bacterium]|nr:hypothetical protein [Clostridia bacterium]